MAEMLKKVQQRLKKCIQDSPCDLYAMRISSAARRLTSDLNSI